MTEVEQRFAERMKAIRTARGWSCQRLANLSGVPRTAISKIEYGERGVPLGDAVALAEALEVPLADMIRPGTFQVTYEFLWQVNP